MPAIENRLDANLQIAAPTGILTVTRNSEFCAAASVRYAEFYGAQSFVKYRNEMEDKDGTITPNAI